MDVVTKLFHVMGAAILNAAFPHAVIYLEITLVKYRGSLLIIVQQRKSFLQ